MALAYRGRAQNTAFASVGGTITSASYTTAPSAGDLLIAAVGFYDTGGANTAVGMTAPTGWTRRLLAVDGSNLTSLCVFTRTASGTSADDFTGSDDNNTLGRYCTVIIAFSGTGALDSVPGATSVTTLTSTAPSTGAAAGHGLACFFWMPEGSGGTRGAPASGPATMTRRDTLTAGLSAYTEILGTAGTRSLTWSGAATQGFNASVSMAAVAGVITVTANVVNETEAPIAAARSKRRLLAIP